MPGSRHYATQAKRTVETASPAKALGLEIRIQSYEDTDGLVQRCVRTRRGQGFVVGLGVHSADLKKLVTRRIPD